MARAVRLRVLGRIDRQAAAGPARKYTGRRILAVLDNPPPAGFTRWTGPLIATELGDVHEQQLWPFLRAQGIDLDERKSWCESNDPNFAAKAADLVKLYMAPPENAIVICVDEKPSIQALERHVVLHAVTMLAPPGAALYCTLMLAKPASASQPRCSRSV